MSEDLFCEWISTLLGANTQMTVLNLLLAFFILNISEPVSGEQGAGRLIAQQTWTVTDGTVVALTVREQKAPAGYTERTLEGSVDSPSGGERVLQFQEADAFTGMFPLETGDGHLLTLWTSGSAYRIRVFARVAKQFKLVLDEGSRFSPELRDLDNDGTLEILITRDRELRSDNRGYRGSRISYRWNTKTNIYDAVPPPTKQ